MTLCNAVNILRVGLATLNQIIDEHLNMSKVCARSMPRMLTIYEKKNRV